MASEGYTLLASNLRGTPEEVLNGLKEHFLQNIQRSDSITARYLRYVVSACRDVHLQCFYSVEGELKAGADPAELERAQELADQLVKQTLAELWRKVPDDGIDEDNPTYAETRQAILKHVSHADLL
jgi:hypothetical protein